MSEFEYVIGIHTIVLGLATASLLSTLADTVKYRKTIRPFWVHTLWCVMLQLTLLGWWYALWRELSEVTTFSYASFLVVFSVSVAFYLMASFLSIDISGDKSIDLEAYFSQIRVPVFLSMGCAYGVVLSLVFLEWDKASSTGSLLLDIVNYTVIAMTPLAGLFLTSRRAQQSVVVVYSIAYLVVEFNQLGIGI